MPARYDFQIWRGNDARPPIIQPRGPGDTVFDHAGSSWRLVAHDAAGAIVLDIVGVIDRRQHRAHRGPDQAERQRNGYRAIRERGGVVGHHGQSRLSPQMGAHALTGAE